MGGCLTYKKDERNKQQQNNGKQESATASSDYESELQEGEGDDGFDRGAAWERAEASPYDERASGRMGLPSNSMLGSSIHP